MFKIQIARWVAGLLLCGAPYCLAADLLQNDNFSQGNTGFISNYAFSNDLGSTGSETRYTVGDNPHNFNSQAASFGDHTTGSGLMLIINGAVTSNVTIWQETVPVSPNAAYHLAGFTRSWGGAISDPSPAILRVEINGQAIGSDTTLPTSVNSWIAFSRDWSSGAATSATIRFVDVNIAEQGNDFAIDDLTFPAVPEPVGLWVIGVGVVGALFRRGRRTSAI